MSEYLIFTTKFMPLAMPSRKALQAIDSYWPVKADAAAAKKRVRSGIASVYGNIDLQDDVVVPGAFDEAIANASKGVMPKFLLNHDTHSLPIGRILSIKSVGASDLPRHMRDAGATGGLLVEKEFFRSQRASDALEASGEMAMSFGFDIVESQFEKRDGRQIRLLTKLKLFEVSDVTFPANPLATAVVSKSLPPVAVKRTGTNIHSHEFWQVARARATVLRAEALATLSRAEDPRTFTRTAKLRAAAIRDSISTAEGKR